MEKISEIFPKDKQPNPVPPPFPVVEAPSILLYVGLLIVASLLVMIAFNISEPDWPGLLLNLASGIIGAVIILIFVDKRLKMSEFQILQEYVESVPLRIFTKFSRDIRITKQYAKVFRNQLARIPQAEYFAIPKAEVISEQNPDGFFLVGEPGIGKSTLLQRFAAETAEEAIQTPTKAQIPIFIPAIFLHNCTLTDSIWKEICKYYVINRKMYENWLSAGRLKVFIDGIDENLDQRYVLNEIIFFRNKFPKNVVICSSRPLLHNISYEEIQKTGLPIVEMPFPPEEEILKRISKFR